MAQQHLNDPENENVIIILLNNQQQQRYVNEDNQLKIEAKENGSKKVVTDPHCPIKVI